MKENLMRGPLLKGGGVLLVFMLLVYLTSTSAEGSVWSSIVTMVVTVFQLVQWVIGMIIGLAVSLAVLFGVFLGAVALANREASSNMYKGLKTSVAKLFSETLACVKGAKCCGDSECSEPQKMQEKVAAVVDAGEVEQVNDMLESRLSDLTDKIHALEAKMSAYASHEKLDKVATEVTASGDALANLQNLISGLESKVEDAAGKMTELSSETLLGDLPTRVKSIEAKDIAEKHDIAPIVDLVERMQDEIRETIEGLAQSEPEVAEESTGDEHRLFSYFDNPADKEKLESLVSETLKKDMTYAQVMSFLEKEMGKEKGLIISEHPSLAKDYIRQRRRG